MDPKHLWLIVGGGAGILVGRIYVGYLKVFAQLDARIEAYQFSATAARVRATAADALLKISAAVTLFIAIVLLPIGIDMLVRRGLTGVGSGESSEAIFNVLSGNPYRDVSVASGSDLMGSQIPTPTSREVSEVWQAKRADKAEWPGRPRPLRSFCALRRQCLLLLELWRAALVSREGFISLSGLSFLRVAKAVGPLLDARASRHAE